jgi:hypothetical protein
VTKRPRRAEIKDLSDAEFERIRAAIGSDAALSRGLVEAAAFYYREEKSRRDAGTGRGYRADLRHLRSCANSFVTALETTQLTTLLIIGVSVALFKPGNSDAVKRIHRLAPETRWLVQAIDEFLLLMKRPMSDFQLGSDLAIDLLARAFELATGDRPTHSAHRDGEYVGGARSLFGRFAVAFFGEVDPALSETAIGNMLRKRLHPSTRKR